MTDYIGDGLDAIATILAVASFVNPAFALAAKIAAAAAEAEEAASPAVQAALSVIQAAQRNGIGSQVHIQGLADAVTASYAELAQQNHVGG